MLKTPKAQFLRNFQHTPGTYPRPPTNSLGRSSFHLGLRGCLGYAPAYVGVLLDSFLGLALDRKSKLWPVGSHCIVSNDSPKDSGTENLEVRYLISLFLGCFKGLGIPLHIGQIPYCLHRCFVPPFWVERFGLLETKNIAIQNRLRFIDFPHSVSWMHLCWYVTIHLCFFPLHIYKCSLDIQTLPEKVWLDPQSLSKTPNLRRYDWMSRDDDQLTNLLFNQMFEGKRTQRYHHVSTLSPNLESETETIPFSAWWFWNLQEQPTEM